LSTLKVKVKKARLIESLEKALADRVARYKHQEKEQAAYEKAVEAYNHAVLKVLKSGKGHIEQATPNYYHSDVRQNKNKVCFTVVVLLPKGALPTQPEQPTRYFEHDYKHETEEISHAIRVLNLTEDEYVSASTYYSVAKYL
jgi:hypothetical protein